MNSDTLKYAVMQYWRFQRQALYIATEVGASGPNIKDVLMVCAGKIIEVECKISASDFAADFKKEKHQYYAGGIEYYNTPNHLYYAIPHDLQIDESLFENYPKYGLIRVQENEKYGLTDRFKLVFVRRSVDLHGKVVSEATRNAQIQRAKKAEIEIFKRMTSDVINVRRRMLKEPPCPAK